VRGLYKKLHYLTPLILRKNSRIERYLGAYQLYMNIVVGRTEYVAVLRLLTHAVFHLFRKKYLAQPNVNILLVLVCVREETNCFDDVTSLIYQVSCSNTNGVQNVETSSFL